jgi:uncharacterized protein (UPF0333 family)
VKPPPTTKKGATMIKVMKKIKNKGQTTLEYALVIGVIVVGAIMMGQSFFGKDGKAQSIFEGAIKNSQDTLKTE